MAIAALDAGAAAPRELFQDPAFAEGFGAGWNYGATYDGGARRRGRVLAYRDIAPHRIHLIPDGPVDLRAGRDHPWAFEEGAHRNFADANGVMVPELHTHRLVVNHVVEHNSPERLQFAQYNNDGLLPGDPGWDRRLAKRVVSDRRGGLLLRYDTQNEIRNVAWQQSARFKDDTWPHLLLVQAFRDEPRLADFEKIEFQLEYAVTEQVQLSPWPAGKPGASPASMNLQTYFFLQAAADPTIRLFAGFMLQSSDPRKYREHAGNEQHGTYFYRTALVGPKNPIELNRRQTLRADLKRHVQAALDGARTLRSDLPPNADDYILASFNFGWEGVGHWLTECELRGLSLRGTPRLPAR